jgi:predicted membrane protein
MNFFFKGYFWAIVIIVAGSLMLINTTKILSFKIPVFSVIVALLLILLGVQLLIGPKNISGIRSSHEVIFDEGKLEANETDDKFDVIFGKSTIDLTQISTKTNHTTVKVDVVFGQGTIKIKKSDPIRIKASSVFGNITLPNGTNVSFGDRTYETDSYHDSDKKIQLKVDVVFGESTILLVE